jgi:hypothetical protein
MPIVGLTTGAPSFKEIGRLRKGAPKSSGKLTDLRYFRPDFRPDEQEAARLFEECYGKSPTLINVRLPFPKVEDVWDANFEVYNTAGMLGRADGKRWFYLRDNKSGKILVKDGFPELPFDPTVPVYSYFSQQKQKDIPVFARPVGKLRIVIPELRRANYVALVTHSWYDCAKISSQLNGISLWASIAGLTLPALPLLLTRRPETVSIAYDGKKRMEEKWLVNIEIRQDWAEAYYRFVDQIMPGLNAPALLPALPSGLSEPEWAEEEQPEGEWDGQVFDQNESEEAETTTDQPPIEQKAQPVMSIELANSVKGSDGKAYGDCTNGELSSKSIGIGKALAKSDVTPEKREDLQFKQAAIATILAGRNGK